MTNTRISSIVIAAVVAATLAWVISHNASTEAQGRQAGTRWEYALFRLSDGKAVLIEAEKQSTVKAPLNRLSGDTSRSQRTADRYSADVKSVRDHDIGALNFFGKAGWEAVSVIPDEKGFTVLMKRSR